MVNVQTFSVLFTILHFAHSQVTCYWLDGSPATNPAGGWNESNYSANVCNPGAAISHCCSTTDYCLSNGLCLNGGSDNYFSTQGCTDKSWASPCVNVCYGGTELGACFPNPAVNGQMTYYCLPFSDGSNDCNNGSNTITLEMGQILIRSFQIPSSLLSSSTSSGSSATATTTQTNITSPPCGNGTKVVKVGVGVGVGLGVPLALALATALILLGLKTRENRRLRDGGAVSTPGKPTFTLQPFMKGGSTRHEVDARHETEWRGPPQELPSSMQ